MRILVLLAFLTTGCSFILDPAAPVKWSFAPETALLRGHAAPVREGAEKWELCNITTPRPTGPKDMRTWEVVYHELRHCWEGAWH